MPFRVSRALLVLAVGLTVGLIAVVVLTRPTSGAATGPTTAPMTGPTTGPTIGQTARSSAPPASLAPAAGARAVSVLHDWDVRRAAAWARGDADALASLYTVGSTAGAADVALLSRYRSRGLVVRDLRMQLLRARVLTSRPRLVELEVTERLAFAVADEPTVGSRALPRDAAATHRLVLRRVAGTWLMAGVSVVPSER